jgi:hypothetical protein
LFVLCPYMGMAFAWLVSPWEMGVFWAGVQFSSTFFVGAYRIPRIRKIRRRAFDSESVASLCSGIAILGCCLLLAFLYHIYSALYPFGAGLGLVVIHGHSSHRRLTLLYCISYLGR